MANFWTDRKFELKQNFNWKIDVQDNKGTSIFSHIYAKSVQKPSFQIDQKQYKLINRSINHPTNVIWQPIELVLVDDIDSTVMKFLKDYLQSIGYSDINEDNTIQADTSSKLEGKEKLGKIIITQYNSTTTRENEEASFSERWTLINPQISSFSNSLLDYSDDNLSTYTFTISYDWATLETPSLAPNETLMKDAEIPKTKPSPNKIDRSISPSSNLGPINETNRPIQRGKDLAIEKKISDSLTRQRERGLTNTNNRNRRGPR